MPDKTNNDGNLTRNDLKAFNRDVASLLLSICNDHDIRWRMPDGRHIILYNGDRSTIPFKVSVSRQPEHTMDFLIKWIETNLPSYFISKPKPAVDPKKDPDPPPLDQESKPLVYTTGRISDYLMRKPDGSIWCTECSFTSDTARGVHLHEDVHNPEVHNQRNKRGAETKRINREARLAQEAADQVALGAALLLIAEHMGFELITSEQRQTIEDYDTVIAERDSLRHEVEDLKAKLALIREAMSV